MKAPMRGILIAAALSYLGAAPTAVATTTSWPVAEIRFESEADAKPRICRGKDGEGAEPCVDVLRLSDMIDAETLLRNPQNALAKVVLAQYRTVTVPPCGGNSACGPTAVKDLKTAEDKQAEDKQSGPMSRLVQIFSTALIRGPVTAVSRNFTALAVPILEGRPAAAIVRDRAALELVWVYGTPPFRLVVESGGTVVAALDGLAARRAVVPLPPFAAPVSTLTLTDAAGEVASYTLRTGVPAAPGAAEDADPVLAALELLARDGRWRLDALDALRRMSGRSALAHQLAGELETGERDWQALRDKMPK